MPYIKMVQQTFAPSGFVTTMFGFRGVFGFPVPSMGWVGSFYTKLPFNPDDPNSDNIVSAVLISSDGYIYGRRAGETDPRGYWKYPNDGLIPPKK